MECICCSVILFCFCLKKSNAGVVLDIWSKTPSVLLVKMQSSCPSVVQVIQCCDPSSSHSCIYFAIEAWWLSWALWIMFITLADHVTSSWLVTIPENHSPPLCDNNNLWITWCNRKPGSRQHVTGVSCYAWLESLHLSAAFASRPAGQGRGMPRVLHNTAFNNSSRINVAVCVTSHTSEPSNRNASCLAWSCSALRGWCWLLWRLEYEQYAITMSCCARNWDALMASQPSPCCT